MEIDPQKAKKVLAHWWPDDWPDPESFAERVWCDLETNARPEPEEWVRCTDETVYLVLSGKAMMTDGQIFRSMYPKEHLYVKCKHIDHRRKTHPTWVVEGRVK